MRRGGKVCGGHHPAQDPKFMAAPRSPLELEARLHMLGCELAGLQHRPRHLEGLASLDVAVSQHSEANEPGARKADQRASPMRHISWIWFSKCATIGEGIVACLGLASRVQLGEARWWVTPIHGLRC